MKRYIIHGTIILSLLFFSLSSHAGEMDINKIRERMNNALGTISMGVKNGELFKVMKRSNELEILGCEVDRSKNSSEIIFSTKIEYSEPFLISLVYDTEAFEDFVSFFEKERIPLSSYFSVLDASWDLEMKARVVKASNTDRVEVTVNTISQQGREVHHCIVWYVPFFKDDDLHRRRFDKFSTPTTDNVPAGNWKIWTEKSGKTGPKTPFYCGDDGHDKREIDILAPEVNENERKGNNM